MHQHKSSTNREEMWNFVSKVSFIIHDKQLILLLLLCSQELQQQLQQWQQRTKQMLQEMEQQLNSVRCKRTVNLDRLTEMRRKVSSS